MTPFRPPQGPLQEIHEGPVRVAYVLVSQDPGPDGIVDRGELLSAYKEAFGKGKSLRPGPQKAYKNLIRGDGMWSSKGTSASKEVSIGLRDLERLGVVERVPPTFDVWVSNRDALRKIAALFDGGES